MANTAAARRQRTLLHISIIGFHIETNTQSDSLRVRLCTILRITPLNGVLGTRQRLWPSDAQTVEVAAANSGRIVGDSDRGMDPLARIGTHKPACAGDLLIEPRSQINPGTRRSMKMGAH